MEKGGGGNGQQVVVFLLLSLTPCRNKSISGIKKGGYVGSVEDRELSCITYSSQNMRVMNTAKVSDVLEPASDPYALGVCHPIHADEAGEREAEKIGREVLKSVLVAAGVLAVGRLLVQVWEEMGLADVPAEVVRNRS
jgi:hypothetical protein